MIQKSLLSRGKAKSGLTEREAIKFLEDRGYVVHKLLEGREEVSKADIIFHFYSQLKANVNVNEALLLNIDDPNDGKAIERFKNKARRLNIKSNDAYKHLFDLISLFFKYYSKLGLRTPPKNLSFLLSQPWIIEKAIKLNKQELDKLAEREMQNLNEDDARLEALRLERATEFLEIDFKNGEKESRRQKGN